MFPQACNAGLSGFPSSLKRLSIEPVPGRSARFKTRLQEMTSIPVLSTVSPSEEQVREQLQRILASPRFSSATRHANFLRYVVESALAGRASEIKETIIATDLYGRDASYDPKADSVVRVEATRLRTRLRAWYEDEGRDDPVVISIPKGTYVPVFEVQTAAPPAPGEPQQAEAKQAEYQQAVPARNKGAVFVAGATAVLLGAALLLASFSRKEKPDREAFAAWQEGVELLRQDPHNSATTYGPPPVLLRALERFEFAVARDPNFARAWASLAEAYDYTSHTAGRSREEDTRRAEAAARRAIALDGSLAAGHHMLGLVLFMLKWDLRGAEAAYRRALELDPRNAWAVVEFVDLLRETGRSSEAAAEIRKARALLPGFPVLSSKEAEIHIDGNRLDAAIVSAKHAIGLNSDLRRAHVALGLALELRGDTGRALECYKQALAMNSRDRRALPALGYLLAKTGRRKEAHEILQTLETLDRQVENRAFQIAVLHMGFGDHGKALEWLERAWQTRQPHLPYATVEPRFRELHAHPKFRAILSRMNLSTP